MSFSFTAFLTILFFSSISIILMYFFLQNNKLIKGLGIGTLSFCIFVIVIRLLIPFEFSFENNLVCKRLFPKIIFFFKTPILKLNGHNICPLHIMGLIWLMGSIIQLSRAIIIYKNFTKVINKFPAVKNSEIQGALRKVLQNYSKPMSFKIIQANLISTPMVLGMRKPWIVIPQIELSENEWYYIFSHEVAHYYHGDLLIKVIVEFLCIIYWWNPFIYLLRGQVSKVLEIHTDLTATKSMGESKRIEYLECLLKIAKYHPSTRVNKVALNFDSENVSTLSQRFHIVLQNSNQKEKFKLKNVFFMVMPVLLLVVLSFCFVFEPYSISPKDASDTVELTKENSYLVKNQDNTYDLYVNNKFFGTVKDIKNLDVSLPIYKNIKEVQKDEKK